MTGNDPAVTGYQSTRKWKRISELGCPSGLGRSRRASITPWDFSLVSSSLSAMFVRDSGM